MKKLLYTIASLAALTAIACTKEQGTPEVRPEIPDTPEEVIEVPATLSGSMGDPTTKVSNDNNGAYKWQASDHVTILTNKGANREFSADEAGLTTEFSGHIPNTDALVGGFALYPASSDLEAAHHSISGTTITFNIPTTLTWGADASYMPMYAPIGVDPEDAEKVKASFKAVGGAMKLICYNIPAGATTLAFTAKSVNIAGNFTLDTTAGTPTLSGEGTGKEIDIDFSGNYSANKVFYIPLPPVTLTGGFTIAFKNGNTVLFTQTAAAAPTIQRNHLVIAPALNCEAVLWSEDFSGFSNGNVPSGEQESGVTYACTNGTGSGSTKIYSEDTAGGTAPELLICKYSGTFTVTGIPTKNATSMVLKFKKNAQSLTVSTTSSITLGGDTSTSTSGEKTVTLTNNGGLSSFDLTFTGPSGNNNVRIDDIKLINPNSTVTAPSIDAPDALTIGVGESSASTTVTLANAVDNLGISALVSGTNADKFTAAISSTTLTVTAKETNSSASDYTAILTLKASGAVSKEIAITQKTKLVPNPAVTVTPGDSKFTATWTADENATSYVAYLHTAQTATPATGGADITSSISNSGSAYSITDYPVTNGTTYYLYVKVNGINSGYVAPSEYVEYSFTPAIWDLKSIAVTTAPTKTTYTAGEFFDPTGLVVTPTFEERGNTSNTKVGDPVDNANLTFDPSTSAALTTSDVSVSISYTVSGITKGTTQAITVNPDTSDHYQKVTSLSNVTAGEYIIVNDGYCLPNADATSAGPAKLAITINNNEVQSVTSAMTWTFTGTTSAMTIQSTADDTKYLSVSGNDNNRIRVNTTSDTWTIADYSGTSGAFTMKDNSNNRYCATYYAGSDWRSYNSYNADNYGDDGRVYLYKLVDNTVWDLKSITAVKTAPTKTAYEAGEYFDPTGLVITATYEDHDGIKADKTEDVAYGNETASAFTFTPSTSMALTTSDESVTISYTENGITKTVSQAITVTAPVVWDLKSIAVKTAPTKTTYAAGGNFDPTGLVITATYKDHAEVVADKTEDVAYGNETASAFTFTPSTSTALTISDESVTISYTESGITKSTTQAITVSADYVTLPWSYPASWTGGTAATSAGLMAINGVTANGLGSDYAVGNAPYQIKLDTTGDYIIIKTDSVIGVVSVKYKMIGGNTSSSLSVQESSDGSSYTDVQSLAISGDQNSTGLLETSTSFKSASRYVKLFFTKGSNVGIGGIAITKGDDTVWDLKSIAVKTAPSKTTYAVGDYFDPTGLVITATYEDHAGVKSDKTEDVAYGNANASQFSFSPSTSTALTTSDESVAISYTENGITKTAASPQAITVKATHTLTLTAPGTGYAIKATVGGVDIATSTTSNTSVSVAEDAVVTISAPTIASGYKFSSWSVSGATVSGNTNPATFTMGTSNVTVTATFEANGDGPSDQSANYSGNVTLSTSGGSNASSCRVTIGTIQYSGIKAGTSNKVGAVKVTVPSGTKYLHIHAAAWNNESVTLTVTPTGYSGNISLTSDSGVSGNTPFTISGDPSSTDYYKVITFTDALEAATDLTFTATDGKRFVIWGVYAEE